MVCSLLISLLLFQAEGCNTQDRFRGKGLYCSWHGRQHEPARPRRLDGCCACSRSAQRLRGTEPGDSACSVAGRKQVCSRSWRHLEAPAADTMPRTDRGQEWLRHATARIPCKVGSRRQGGALGRCWPGRAAGTSAWCVRGRAASRALRVPAVTSRVPWWAKAGLETAQLHIQSGEK